MLPPGSVSGCCSVGVMVQTTGVLNTAVTGPSAPGGVRDSALLGVLRKYSGFEPDDGMPDGETMSVGAAGVAPTPPGLVTVAVLSMGVPGDTPAAMRASNTTLALPFAATKMLPMLTRPVPFAPVPAPADVFVAPGGMLTTARLPSSAARSSTMLTPVAAMPAVSTSLTV